MFTTLPIPPEIGMAATKCLRPRDNHWCALGQELCTLRMEGSSIASGGPLRDDTLKMTTMLSDMRPAHVSSAVVSQSKTRATNSSARTKKGLFQVAQCHPLRNRTTRLTRRRKVIECNPPVNQFTAPAAAPPTAFALESASASPPRPTRRPTPRQHHVSTSPRD